MRLLSFCTWPILLHIAMRPVRVQDITTAFLDCGGSFCHDKTGRANIFFYHTLKPLLSLQSMRAGQSKVSYSKLIEGNSGMTSVCWTQMRKKGRPPTNLALFAPTGNTSSVPYIERFSLNLYSKTKVFHGNVSSTNSQ